MIEEAADWRTRNDVIDERHKLLEERNKHALPIEFKDHENGYCELVRPIQSDYVKLLDSKIRRLEKELIDVYPLKRT